jgi:hypothetical protein
MPTIGCLAGDACRQLPNGRHRESRKFVTERLRRALEGGRSTLVELEAVA